MVVGAAGAVVLVVVAVAAGAFFFGLALFSLDFLVAALGELVLVTVVVMGVEAPFGAEAGAGRGGGLLLMRRKEESSGLLESSPVKSKAESEGLLLRWLLGVLGSLCFVS